MSIYVKIAVDPTNINRTTIKTTYQCKYKHVDMKVWVLYQCPATFRIVHVWGYWVFVQMFTCIKYIQIPVFALCRGYIRRAVERGVGSAWCPLGSPKHVLLSCFLDFNGSEWCGNVVLNLISVQKVSGWCQFYSVGDIWSMPQTERPKRKRAMSMHTILVCTKLKGATITQLMNSLIDADAQWFHTMVSQ